MNETEWMLEAACRGEDVDLFFSEQEPDQRRALAVCSGCAVQERCRQRAFDEHELYGVWGGTTGAERRRIFRRARRQRAAGRRETEAA